MATYSSRESAISRTKVRMVKLNLDYCANTFGVAPCTASGSVKCFNTFGTCEVVPKYIKSTKIYKFVDYDIPVSLINQYAFARPYIKTISELPTELQDTNTVVRRMKFDLLDEPDTDIGIDPYKSTRSSVQGSFWKKLIARNPNYKGRLIEYWEGYDGVAEADFQLKFVGQIDNITITSTRVTIEAVDLLKALSDIVYPIELNIYNIWPEPNIIMASNEQGMLSSNANLYDYCERSDFKLLTITSTNSSNLIGDNLASGNYYITIVAFDNYDRPFAKSNEVTQFVATDPSYLGDIEINWNTVTNAVYYWIYIKLESGNYLKWQKFNAPTTAATLSTLAGIAADPESAAILYYYLFTSPGYVISSWIEFHDSMDIDLNDASTLNNSGYIQLDKEIFYYASISGNTLQNIKRHQLGTSPTYHPLNSIIYELIYEAPGNPFTILKKLLSYTGIASSYIDSKFTQYESAWSGINFSSYVITQGSKLSDIFFDLVNVVDCMSWQNESGLITIRYNDELPANYSNISDEANIILNSTSVDLNSVSQFTRWLLFWNRIDVTKSLTDNQAYNHLNIDVNTDLEGPNGLGLNGVPTEIPDEEFTTWINDDCGSSTDINTYINALLVKREQRAKQAREIITCDVEMKDSQLLTGQIIQVSSAILEDINGNNYSNVLFRIIRRSITDNKINLKLKRFYL